MIKKRWFDENCCSENGHLLVFFSEAVVIVVAVAVAAAVVAAVAVAVGCCLQIVESCRIFWLLNGIPNYVKT